MNEQIKTRNIIAISIMYRYVVIKGIISSVVSMGITL